MAAESPLRIANVSGFFGDRLSAAREMLKGGEVDFLTGDYLAELTMLILWKARQKDPQTGYATTFLRQMEEVLGLALERGVRVVTNAGGLHPAGLAAALREQAERLALRPKILHVEGDDVLPRLEELRERGHALANLATGRPLAELEATPVSANAYLGAWGIVTALEQGADVVVCPRVTDASLVLGPAAWHYGWGRDDWDRLASGVVAGHVLECGPQATGGNYAFFQEVSDLRHPGFPIAEVHEDGSFVVTKHPDTGGLVSRGTVTAQLLYELGPPAYANPDVVARFDSIRIEEVGPDRVRFDGIRGEPAPRDVKVCINYVGGYRNSMTFVLTGLDIEEKARLAETALFEHLGGREQFAAVDVRLARTDRPDPETNEQASATLTVTVKDPDARKVGRRFSGAVIELMLGNYPGMYCTTPPSREREYGVYWPALLPAEEVEAVVVTEAGERLPVPRAETGGPARAFAGPEPVSAEPPSGPSQRRPLGLVFGARSGDKGGDANVGVWARSDAGYAWLERFLTAERFRELLPETRSLEVRRYELPNLRALNFVVVGLLGEGVASSTRMDAQAKSLGEFLRAREVDLPDALLADAPKPARG